MRIFCPAICRTLFLDVFPVSGRVPLIAALKERDIFITCASRYGLNPAMPGSSPRSGTDPELGRVACAQTDSSLVSLNRVIRGPVLSNRHFYNAVYSLK